MIYCAKITKLLQPMRFWGEEQKKLVRPLSMLAQTQHDKIKKLENEIWEFKQATLLDPVPDRYNGRASTLNIDDSPVHYSLAERCQSMYNKFGIESEQSIQFMALKGLSSDEFLALVKDATNENI